MACALLASFHRSPIARRYLDSPLHSKAPTFHTELTGGLTLAAAGERLQLERRLVKAEEERARAKAELARLLLQIREAGIEVTPAEQGEDGVFRAQRDK